jgi:hypothetical protein
VFALPTVQAIIDTLEADGSEWAQSTRRRCASVRP